MTPTTGWLEAGITPIPELRISKSRTHKLPPGWPYGDIATPDRRELYHDTGVSVLVAEADLDATLDWLVFCESRYGALDERG